MICGFLETVNGASMEAFVGVHSKFVESSDAFLYIDGTNSRHYIEGGVYSGSLINTSPTKGAATCM